MKERLLTILDGIRSCGNYRRVRYLRPLSSTRIHLEGKEYLNLCSNSYLSLHTHSDVISAAKIAMEEHGAGSCSSRSVSGSIELYRELETGIALYKGYREGLIFPNGYMANLGVVSTLAMEEDIIFSDELNHSSLIDAMRLSRAKKIVYRHRDISDLDKKLAANPARGRQIVITETIFSMDGDIAPLHDIHELKKRYGLFVVVDDAHGTGVFGENGTGVEELFHLAGEMDVHVGTFGKSLGSFGAFVLSDPVVIEFLVNRARTFMYTTALPPAVLGAALAALKLINTSREYKNELWIGIDYLRKRLLDAGFDLKNSEGPIIPIVVGEDAKTVQMQEYLMTKGLFLQAIRPPTVPSGTSRLRLTVVKGFTEQDMDYTIDALVDAGRKMKLI